jgi:parallel beta-helix repeat protein
MKHMNLLKLAGLILLLNTQCSAAVTSGVYTIGTGGNYANFAAALSDLSSSTISGPVVFNILTGTYTAAQIDISNIPGSSAANTITFQSMTGNPANVTISYAATSSSNNFIFRFNGASHVTVKNLTINNTGSTYGTDIVFTGDASYDSVINCVLTGSTSSSTSNNKARIVANPNAGNDNVIKDNVINGGSYGVYWYGSSTSSLNSGGVFDNNTFTNNYYGGIYSYYAGSTKVTNNHITASGVSTFYCYYFYYPQEGLEISNNTAVVSSSSTTYGIYSYYSNYYTTNPAATPIVIRNNDIEIHNTFGTTYGVYNYRNSALDFSNNRIAAFSTSGTIYNPYYLLAYAQDSKAEHNLFTSSNSSGTVYSPYYGCYYATNSSATDNKFSVNKTSGSAYCPYYGLYNGSGSVLRNDTFEAVNTSGSVTHYYCNAFGTNDTFENNLVKSTASSITNYCVYYLVGLTRNNRYELNSTGGNVSNYFYYGNGGTFMNNTIKAVASSYGTVYGLREFMPTTSYQGASIIGNTFDLQSTNGTVYGVYGDYFRADKIISNVISTKTAGSSYLVYNPSGLYGDAYMFNNTLHSNSTGTTNYLLYHGYAYSGKLYMYNNIFSRSSNSGQAVYVSDTSNYQSDYNLYYAGNGSSASFQSNTPTVSATSLSAWRAGTQKEMNSLVYDPGFVDAANLDFRPDTLNPNAWSVQGRGIHLPGDTLDLLGNARPGNRFEGVPDLGAYEFTPVSTPPDAIASPATPAPGIKQVFTFGDDTVGAVQWGVSAPSTVSVKQYTGLQANPMQPPTGVGRAYFTVSVNAPTGVYDYKPVINYKDPWLGDISSETNARIAKSSNGGTWQGYNYTNGVTDTVADLLYPQNNFDSLSSTFTAVENARIGIRCVISPTGLTHSLVSADSAVESWDAVFSPFGYQVIVDNSPYTPAPPYTGLQFSGSNAYTIKGLTEDTKYYVHVRTICGTKDTSAWAIDTLITLITCHDPVLAVNSITANHALVYWDTVKTAAQYEYIVSQDPNPPLHATITTNNAVLASGLLPATQYWAHVRSHCNNVYSISPGWTTITFTTLQATDVNNVSGNDNEILVYPNPVKDVLTVQVADKMEGTANVAIADIAGKILRTVLITKQKTEINVSGLPSGLYFVKYTNDRKTVVTKVHKE